MGRKKPRELHKEDTKTYPSLTGLLGAYLHQDAALVSGSFEAAVEEMVEASQDEFYSSALTEVEQLLGRMTTEKEVEQFFRRHTQWLLRASYRKWFFDLRDKLRRAQTT
jgi:hypothetical protein